jgi:uncharacterized membrane protein
MTAAKAPDALEEPRSSASSTERAASADWVIWLIASAVFGCYATLSVFRYLRLQPTTYDLGIFTEYVRQYSLLHAPFVGISRMDLLGEHFHPILAILAPFFRLFPTPVTLLVAQALLVALSVVAVSRIATVRLGAASGRLIGAAYGFSWGLQQLINFDFHEVAFAIPLIALSLSALIDSPRPPGVEFPERRAPRYKAAVLWALPLVLVKEDQGFTVAAIGLLLALHYRHRIAGSLLAAWGLTWSVLAITVIIPHFNPSHQYPYWSQGGQLSDGRAQLTVPDLIHNLVAYPSAKLPTLALILLPTAFLALRSPLILVAVPGLLLRFVSTDSAYWGTTWHYNATVMPIVFIAAIDAITRIRAREGHFDGGASLARRTQNAVWAPMARYGPAMMIAVAAALSFQFPLAALWNPQTYQIDNHVAAARAAMALVPDDTTVETDMDLLAPLAARDQVFWFGTPNSPATRYIVFDSTSTDYQPPPKNAPAFIASLHPKRRYTLIYDHHGVYVFRLFGIQRN